MKAILKDLLYRLAPSLTDQILSLRAHARIRRLRITSGLAELEKRFLTSHAAVVEYGPFAGMKYLTDSCGSVLAPKILGTYEMELAPWLSQLLSSKPSRIVDVGCAEGYYAVGLARKLPDSTIHAFDTSFVARRACKHLAEMNNVGSRVNVHGRCNHATLNTFTGAGSLVVCDIEGGEVYLLDALKAPNLRFTTILVEMHDDFVAKASEIIRHRFEATHAIQEVTSTPRQKSDLARPLVNFTDSEILQLLSEQRASVQRWFLLTPRG